MNDEPPILLNSLSSSSGNFVGQFRQLLGEQRSENLPAIDSSGAATHSGIQQYYYQPVLPDTAPQYLQHAHLWPTDRHEASDQWQPANQSVSEREYIIVRRTKVGHWESGVVNAVEYECRICGRRCRWRSSISVHIRTHTGRKPYQCRVCQMRFSDSSTRNKHEKKAHNLKFSTKSKTGNSQRLSASTAGSELQSELKCHLCFVSHRSESDLAEHVNQFHHHVVPRFPEAFAGLRLARGVADVGVGVDVGGSSGDTGVVSFTREPESGQYLRGGDNYTPAAAFQCPTTAWSGSLTELVPMDGAVQYHHQHHHQHHQHQQQVLQYDQEHIPLPAATAVGDVCSGGEMMGQASALDLLDGEINSSCYPDALLVIAPDGSSGGGDQGRQLSTADSSSSYCYADDRRDLVQHVSFDW